MSKKRKKPKTKITRLDLLKMQRKANRELAPHQIRGGAHLTDKKDVTDRQKNTLSLGEIDNEAN